MSSTSQYLNTHHTISNHLWNQSWSTHGTRVSRTVRMVSKSWSEFWETPTSDPERVLRSAGMAGEDSGEILSFYDGSFWMFFGTFNLCVEHCGTFQAEINGAFPRSKHSYVGVLHHHRETTISSYWRTWSTKLGSAIGNWGVGGWRNNSLCQEIIWSSCCKNSSWKTCLSYSVIPSCWFALAC